MAIELSTAGIQLLYAVEDTAGTTSPAGLEFTRIKGVKSLPDMNPEPSTLETTSLDALEFKTYIDGLKDIGGALTINFNMSEEFMTNWTAVCTKYKAAKALGKKVWWEFLIPGLTKAFFFQGNPTDMGFGGAEVDSVLEMPVYVTPTGNIGWDTKIEETVSP